MTPTWTHHLPARPGWYWYSCGEDSLMMVEAVDYGATMKDKSPRLWIKSRRRYYWADNWQEAYGGFWLGPVRPPELPKVASKQETQ